MKKKKISLLEAARLIGISKKSLDDYYCQLRLGEGFNFDFTTHLYEKMGVLRSYVKGFKPEQNRSRRRQNQHHPKELKIINYYDI